MDQEKLLQLQMQMRNNNEDYKNFLDDMDSWSNEMKSKESGIKNLSDTKKPLPKIRNTPSCNKPKVKQPKVCDYQYWDKFDVDKALEEIETAIEENLQFAIELKEEGNIFFKNGDYLSAISKYSEAISHDAKNDVLFTNRAMSYIKLGNFEAGEIDCTQAIAINNKSVKSFYRRAICRKSLDKREEALSDYKIVLSLEPGNKSALKEMKELQIELNTRGVVEPLFEPLENRISTKPLRRIEIIDVDPNKSIDQSSVQTEPLSAPIDKIDGNNQLKMSTAKEKVDIDEKIDFRVPKTCVQLSKDLSIYRKSPNLLAGYVVRINCLRYNKLIGCALDCDLLLDIVNGLCWAVKLGLLSLDKFVESFDQLQKVSRFSSAWFMISSEEKALLNEVVAPLDRDLLKKLPLIN